jgi:RNA polymerase sigma factor (sigma-70 family)
MSGYLSSGMRVSDADLGRYKGLVYKTSQMYADLLGWEREDLQQVLLTRVWLAIAAYDPKRSALPEERFVFSCLRNQIKDMVKSKTRRDKHGRQVYIADLTSNGDQDFSDRFEFEHLSELPEEREALALPETLTPEEREVIALLYVGYRQTEIAIILTCQRRDIERRVRTIRRKLVDWRPSATGDADIIELEARVRRVLQRAAA